MPHGESDAKQQSRAGCNSPGWESPLELPLPGRSEVHIWWVDLDGRAPELPDLRPLLSHEEEERASRFRFQRHRDRFCVARATLRVLLGLYTEMHPARLRLSYGPHGKPCLEGQGVLRFNLSHSQGFALYAFALQREVGVDLEMIRQDFDWEAVARQLLSAAEIASISALPEADRLRRFFTLWTRKEALAKALGEGLALPLRRLELPLAGAVSPVSLHDEETAWEGGLWSILDLDVGHHLAAALAAEGEPPAVGIRKWDRRAMPLSPRGFVRFPASLPPLAPPPDDAGRGAT